MSPRRRFRDSIRFVLDGDVVELHNVDPTRTVLQYLREDVKRSGSKEGCAEGDCGACTVAIAELDESGERLRVRAINSCIQFLATLDGRELITVENLRSQNHSLHPVQQAMVDCHGSQCGFCTPGFVMSLFAHYKSSRDSARPVIDNVVAGNLCRCTGYRPILEAAKQMYDLSADCGHDWVSLPDTANEDIGPQGQKKVRLLKSLQNEDSLRMENAGRRFYAPMSAQELGELLEKEPDATVLAGGTDVGLWVTK